MDYEQIVKGLSAMSQEDDLRNMRGLAAMLHSVYFGTLQALKRDKEFFGVYEVALQGVNETVGNYFSQLKEKDLQTLLSNLEKTGIYQGLELRQKGGKYIFTIKKCLFAGGKEGVHNTIKGIDLPCPIALAVGAALSRQNTDKKVYIYPSVYEPEGTATQIDVTTPEDYKKRLNALQKLSKGRK